MAKRTVIYVLKCEGGRYYVGKSTNLKRRIREHEIGKGSYWTQMHRPLRIHKLYWGDARKEMSVTAHYMDNYGINNVRGGEFSKGGDYDESQVKWRLDQLDDLVDIGDIKLCKSEKLRKLDKSDLWDKNHENRNPYIWEDDGRSGKAPKRKKAAVQKKRKQVSSKRKSARPKKPKSPARPKKPTMKRFGITKSDLNKYEEIKNELEVRNKVQKYSKTTAWCIFLAMLFSIFGSMFLGAHLKNNYIFIFGFFTLFTAPFFMKRDFIQDNPAFYSDDYNNELETRTSLRNKLDRPKMRSVRDYNEAVYMYPYDIEKHKRAMKDYRQELKAYEAEA